VLSRWNIRTSRNFEQIMSDFDACTGWAEQQ
jgi:hypothetical protein